jgi:hypothetical protein
VVGGKFVNLGRTPASTQRLQWLDLFRGFAVLGMVWTHAANTFLDARLQETSWYREISYYHGFIAPAFFWIAGFLRARVSWGMGACAAEPGAGKSRPGACQTGGKGGFSGKKML